MPRIEGGGPIRPSISSRVDVFTPNVSQAGMAERANAEIGQQVSQIGMQIADRTKRTEDSSYAFDSAVADHQKISAAAAEDLTKNGAAGHSERMKALVAKTYDDRISNAPSSKAAELYHQKTANIFADSELTSQKNETLGIAQKSREGLKNQADVASRALLRTPDPKVFYESRDLFNSRVDEAVAGGSIGVDDAERIKKEGAQFAAKSLFDGYLGKGDAGLDQGMQALKDKTLTENLSVDDLDRFQKSFKSATDVRDAQQFGEAKLFMQDAIADVAAGNQVDPKQVSAALGTLSRGKKANPLEVARIQNEFRVASAVSSATSDLKNYPIYEWGNKAQDALAEIRGKDKTWGAKEELQYMSMYRNHVNKMLEQTKKDAFGFSVSASPDFQRMEAAAGNDPTLNRQLQEKSLAWQEQMGIPPEDRKIARPDQVLQWSTALQQTKNAEQTDMVVKQIQTMYGPRTPMVLAQMSKENKEFKGFEVAGYLDGGARRDVADSILNKAEYKKTFDDNFSDQASTLKSELASQTAEYTQALVEGNSDRSKIERANEFREAIELNAKRLMARGATDNAKDAVRMSSEMVFSKFDTVSAGRTKALISKDAYGPSSKDDVTAWIDWNTTKNGLKNLDIALPPEHLAKFTAAYGNSPETTKRAKENLAGTLQDQSRWVTNQSQDGVYLVQDNGIDPPKPLFNTSGKLVEYKYRDMKEHDVKTQKYQDTANAFKDTNKKSFGLFGDF